MKVIKNLISEEEFQLLQEKTIHNNFFPWFLSKGTSYKNDGLYQLFHFFYNEDNITSPLFDLIRPILKQLNVRSLIKAKLNMQPKTTFVLEPSYHTDNSFNCTTAIFYLNTNNGYTKFKDGTKIESISNRAIYFDSDLMHFGSTCTDKDFRFVLNINYF